MTDRPSFITGMTRSGGGGGGTRRDIVVTVKGYDTDNGVMTVEDQSGVFDIVIADRVKARVEASHRRAAEAGNPVQKGDFEGYVIDSRMAEYIPVGEKVILEGMIDYKARGEDQKKPFPVEWIHTTPVNDDKLVEGMVSLFGSAKRKEVWKVMLWESQALPDSEADKLGEAIDAAAEAHARAVAENGKAPTKAAHGFSVRAVKDGEVVMFTPPVHGIKGDNGYRLMTGDDLKAAVKWMQDQAPEGATVEITPYRAYSASQSVNVHGPASTMLATTSATGLKEGDEDMITNSIYAAPGLIKLSPGKLNARTGERAGEENDWANEVFCGAKKDHVMALVLSSNGEKLEVADELGLVFPNKPGQNQGQSQSNTASQAQSEPEPEATPEPAPEEGDGFDDLPDDDFGPR